MSLVRTPELTRTIACSGAGNVPPPPVAGLPARETSAALDRRPANLRGEAIHATTLALVPDDEDFWVLLERGEEPLLLQVAVAEDDERASDRPYRLPTPI